MLRPESLLAILRALLAVASLSWAPCAYADDLSDFEAARLRYDRRDYVRAVDAFRKLVGSDPPRITNALLVLESRKYYAASLLFVGAADEARLQFRLLLQQEPDYALDPLAFPTEVVALFEEVKSKVRRELEQKLKDEQAQKNQAEQELEAAAQRDRYNLVRLRTLAETAELRVENSRWIASVPFGVGQFQNGDKGLGVALAMAEGLAAAASVVSYIGHQTVADDRPSSSELGQTRQSEQLWRVTNRVSFTTFAVLAVVGIIDAHVRFVHGRASTAPRPLPPDLDRWLREQGQVPPLRWRF